MNEVDIPRFLVDVSATDAQRISHQEIVTLPGNIILLGEAGGGKTWLTEWLGKQDGYNRCTARALIDGGLGLLRDEGCVLVIDALDEVAAQREGDAVNLVLQRLRDAAFPRFILSCRSSEWRAATMAQAIAEQYGKPPLQLELQPLDEHEAREFLIAHLGAQRSRETVERFSSRGLGEWLGNPQTLLMLADVVARNEDLPENARGLFNAFVDIAWFEHSQMKPNAPLQKLGKEAALDALGAGFASLILTGSTTLSDKPRHKLETGDLASADVATLPDAQALEAALSSRLCSGARENRTYQHRRIGEYLGAKWLAKQADTPKKRVRLLAMLRVDGIVPASLRGLHAWLIDDEELATDVIRADPLGVIEYGDADSLTPHQAKALFAALGELGTRNPQFFAGYSPRARSLTHPNLLANVWRTLTEFDDAKNCFVAPFSLRRLLITQFEAADLVTAYTTELREVMLDTRQEFAIRSHAGEVLARRAALSDWPDLLEALRRQATADACRLAVELLDDVGFEQLTDAQLVELVLAHERVTLVAYPREQDDHTTVGTTFRLRKDLPTNRLDGVLNEFAAYLEPYAKDHGMMIEAFDLRQLLHKLIARRLESPGVDPLALWRWLEPLQGNRSFQDERAEVDTWLKRNDEARRAIQRYVLFDAPGDRTIFQRRWRLYDGLPGITATEADAVLLLAQLNGSDEDWKELLQFVPHDAERGNEVREAAKRFVANRPDMLKWIDDLAVSRDPPWKFKQDERDRKQRARRAVAFAEHRNYQNARKAEMLAGDWSALLHPARGYFNEFSDLDRGTTPLERLSDWLGEDLLQTSLTGFEVFLQIDPPPEPSAEQIAEGYANGKHWWAAKVLAAGLVERERTGKGFDDLPDERLIAGLLEIEQGLLRSDEAKALGDALEMELSKRDRAFERYARLLMESGLRNRVAHITGMYGLLRDQKHAEAMTVLAEEWLKTIPQMAAEAEEELIDRQIASGKRDALRALASERLPLVQGEQRRRRNWQAIALWTDFEAAAASLTGVGVTDPDLLWTLRARFRQGRWRDEGEPLALSAAQLSWIIGEFRLAYPQTRSPSGVRSGDTNPWDASEYLGNLIGQLGDVTSDDAVAQLKVLADAPVDGYTDYLRRVATEQAAKRAEQRYQPPTLDQLKAVLIAGPPQSHSDLQQTVLLALERVQARIKSDEADCWVGFYRDDRKTSKDEEPCSDHLKLLLEAEERNVTFNRETHLGNDREGDISCSVGAIRIPIEVKGQWHPDLWKAAVAQLGEQQAVDHLAEGWGVYLVLWFGLQGSKKLQKPPKDVAVPQTAAELESALSEALKISGGHDRLRVMVLDLSRPC